MPITSTPSKQTLQELSRLIFQKRAPAVPDVTLIREHWNKEGMFDTPPAPTGCSACRGKRHLQHNSPFGAHRPLAPVQGEPITAKLLPSQHPALVMQPTEFCQRWVLPKGKPRPQRGADTPWKPRRDARRDTAAEIPSFCCATRYNGKHHG